MKPRFAIRADHEKRYYQVYEIETGRVPDTCCYRYRSEDGRWKAADRAVITCKSLNEMARDEKMGS